MNIATIMKKVSEDILTYNKSLGEGDREISEVLCDEIMRVLTEAECKVWHRHPVWFLDGNPVVGYSKRKDSIKLL